MKIIPPFVRQRIAHRPNLLKIVDNIGWLYFERILRLAIGLVVTVWMARVLGPANFGLLNYALAWVAIAAVLASLGMNRVLVREISEAPEHAGHLLGTVWLLRLCLGGLILFVFYLFALVASQDVDPGLVSLIAIISLGMVFQSFDVVEQFFLARTQSKYSVIARSIGFLCVTLVKILLLVYKAPLVSFAYAAAAEIILMGLSLLFIYQQREQSLNSWNFDTVLAGRLLRESWPEMIAGLGVLVFMRIDQIMLGHLDSSHAMGLYAAALRLSDVWIFIPQLINNSVFPALVRIRQRNPELYYLRIQQLMSTLFAIYYVIAISMMGLAYPVMHLLYGEAYAQAAGITMIHVWCGLFIAMGLVSGSWLLAERRLHLSMYRSLLGAFSNIGLNLILIPDYGIFGAAVGTLISQIIAFYVFDYFHPEMRLVFFIKTKAFALSGLTSMHQILQSK